MDLFKSGKSKAEIGRVIGKEVQLNGTNTRVLSGSNDLAFLPGGGVTLVE